MAGNSLLIDTLLRGMVVGAELLIALALLSRRPVSWRRGLGAAFIIATACYIINSSPSLAEPFGPVIAPIRILSIVAPVIFWWFALSLFDDNFRWRWPVLVPMAFVAPLVVFHFTGVSGGWWTASLVLSRLTMIGAFGHAMYTAIRFLNDDLIEGRRRFRVMFAIAVGIAGFIINYAEIFHGREATPAALMIFQAASILVLTLGFGVWLLGARPEVLDGDPKRAAIADSEPGEAPMLRAADRPAYEKLMRLMADGVWREEGLTVPGLAEKVGVPEHQLRTLINGQLGARNFAAFLNSYRLEEAKRLLADPNEARKQVLQIALEVGFGSIAPFNRAFKEATGMTPTEHRRKELGES
jgi:AraC-like DNA-binding protein